VRKDWVQKDFKKIIRRFFIWQAIVRGQSVSTEGPFLIKGIASKGTKNPGKKTRINILNQHMAGNR
jgi:hypothetical protein